MYVSTPSVGPFAADASLHLIAESLVETISTGHLPPAIVEVRADGAAVEVGLHPLGDDHPTEHLLGMCASEDCFALGVVVGGWARPLRPEASHLGRTRVHVASLLSRSGEFAYRTIAEDPSHPLAVHDPEATASGEQIDLLRRALDIPTDVPPVGADALWAVDWLVTLLHQAPDDWCDAAALHPAMVLLGADDPHDPHDRSDGRDDAFAPRLVDLAPDSFAEVVASFGRVCTWARLRELTVDGAYEAPGLTASDAAWLDVGSFARWILARCPPLADLRHQVAASLPPATADAVERVLTELDIPTRIWPEAA